MKKIICLLLMATTLISCNEKNSLNGSTDFEEKKVKVIKERDSNHPWIPYEERSIPKNYVETRSALTVGSAVGRAYKVDESHDPMLNVGINVIDMKKFTTENPGYYIPRQTPSGTGQAFSYAGFSRYEKNSSKTKTVSSGFGINLGLFSIGAKNKQTKVFTSNVVNERNRVFGELYMQIKDSSFIIKPTENILNKFNNCLHKNFKEELYMNTPEQFFKSYGGLVIAGYTSGGYAEAMYSAVYNGSSSLESVEKDMDASMDASYGFNYKKEGDGKVSGDLGIGKKYSNSTGYVSKLTNMSVSIRTMGGRPEYASFTIPKSIDNIDVNLNEWMKTLSDKSTHTIVEFTEDGLIPITEFIMEQNLKKHYKELYKEGVTTVKRMQEPKIYVDFRWFLGAPRTCYITLQTRFGNDIILKELSMDDYEGSDDVWYELNEITRKMPLKMTSNEHTSLFTEVQVHSVKNYFDVNNMKKYISPDGVIYLISGTNAYSIYNNIILDDYLIRNFVNGLPTVEMTMEQLKRGYTINAL